MKIPTLLLLFTVCWLGCVSSDPAIVEPDPEPSGEYTGLKAVAPYPVGVALQSRHLTSSPHTRIVERVFSSLTAEYEMKMKPLLFRVASIHEKGAAFSIG